MVDKKESLGLQKNPEKAVLVCVIPSNRSDREIDENLDELKFLAETAGVKEDSRFIQRLDRSNPKTYLGTGRLEELRVYLETKEINLVIFDDELSLSQLKNLSNCLSCKILDRTSLILDIFAIRAKTAYAKTQVELAQYQYLLPRLTRMWTHLERQRGGGITMRGPGETQIETDRRLVLSKIAKLKEQLKKIDRQMTSQRGNRGEMARVSLIGYTNVGKSTLMNVLTKSNLLAENKLFATLDTTVRKMVIHSTPFLLSDTVGFIRKLPTQLIQSFRSTLDEVRESDLLMHIVDISHSNFEEQITVVQQTMHEIGIADKPILMIFNKIDLYPYSLDELKNTWMAKNHTPCLFISAAKKINLDQLRHALYEKVEEIIKKND